MNVVITGGGTGGHLAVARAIKEELVARGIRPVFIGSTGGQDRAWFEGDQGWEATYFLPSRGVMNKGFFGKISALASIIKSGSGCIALFDRHRIDAVISVGGYSAAPAALAATVSGKALYIHEQNAVTGSLNRLLRHRARAFFSSFDPASPCGDYPVATRFFEAARIRTSVKTVIFLGGSQGAKAINDLALALADDLHARGIAIIHQCGTADYDRVTSFYRDRAIPADCFPFDKNIVARYAHADFAVSRAGASALFELAANALPTFFVPYPHAAGDHQTANARYLADRGLADFAPQNDLDPSAVLAAIDADPAPVSRGLNAFIRPGGAGCIVDTILKS